MDSTSLAGQVTTCPYNKTSLDGDFSSPKAFNVQHSTALAIQRAAFNSFPTVSLQQKTSAVWAEAFKKLTLRFSVFLKDKRIRLLSGLGFHWDYYFSKALNSKKIEVD